MKKTSLFFGLLLTAFLLTSCPSKDDPVKARNSAVRKAFKKGRVKIALTVKENSTAAKGFLLAAKKINGSGGILGAKIKCAFFYDGETVHGGEVAAYSIANDNEILAAIGHTSSLVTEHTMLLYQYYGILNINPFSTSSSLTEPNLDLFFSSIPSDILTARTASNFCRRRGCRRIMIYYEDSAFGTSLANAFELFTENNDGLIVDRASFGSSYETSDFIEQAVFWKRNFSFDAVFIAGDYPALANAISSFSAMGIDVPVITDDSINREGVPEFFDRTGVRNVYFVTDIDRDSTRPMFVEAKESFQDEYGFPIDNMALYAYDALFIIKAAVEKAGTIDIDRIKAVLTSGTSFPGAIRDYAFSRTGDITSAKSFVNKIDGGRVMRDSGQPPLAAGAEAPAAAAPPAAVSGAQPVAAAAAQDASRRAAGTQRAPENL